MIWRIPDRENASGGASFVAGRWHGRGYLPHFEVHGVPQFVTFRLADSLPSGRPDRLCSNADDDADGGVFEQWDEELDRGHGARWLQRTEVAGTVRDALLHGDGNTYRLLAWTIMPNHVHVLVSIHAGSSLGAVVGSWKSFSARRANRVLGRAGRFWSADYFDRFIRGLAHCRAVIRYIHGNPVKAGLVRRACDWRWGSANEF